jgi:membrane peptidoglycan carboxypeptidase
VPKLQALAEQAVKAALSESGVVGNVSQAALVAMRPDGAVVAMVGGREYGKDQFNRAVQAQRQPGSAFKTFVYFAALRNGVAPDSLIEDAPIEIDGWQPENYGRKYAGTVTVADAFARSLNAATVRLATSIGIDRVAKAAKDLGIDAPLIETPSLALGTSEVSLLDLTGAYASIKAGVMPIQPWGIAAFGPVDRPDSVSVGAPMHQRRPIGPGGAELVSLLRDVVDHGTGRGTTSRAARCRRRSGRTSPQPRPRLSTSLTSR